MFVTAKTAAAVRVDLEIAYIILFDRTSAPNTFLPRNNNNYGITLFDTYIMSVLSNLLFRVSYYRNQNQTRVVNNYCYYYFIHIIITIVSRNDKLP